mmetsp:Transcript_24823/g.35587  ORF Transcript_24823/g.35587 Transcript_24823/m.35587 type:complete len:100 (+) Transcript_24823:108-407(+)
MSNLLLELSSLDGNKKTSMIVMGTNVGSILKEPKAANLAMITTLLLVIRSFLRRLLNVAFSQAALFFKLVYNNALSPSILFFTALFRSRRPPNQHFRQD